MDIKKIIDDAHRAARKVATEFSSITSRILDNREQLKRRRRNLLGALEPAAALKANADRIVDATGARFRDEWGRSMVRQMSVRFEETSSGKIRRSAPSLLNLPDGQNPLVPLCAFFPELMKAEFHRMIDEANVDGIPAADREAQIAAIDEQIRQLEDEHLDFVEQAGKMEPPVTIQPIPEARARRQHEREVRDAKDEAARQMREISKRSGGWTPGTGVSLG
jgi:hypothetical protein